MYKWCVDGKKNLPMLFLVFNSKLDFFGEGRYPARKELWLLLLIKEFFDKEIT